MWEIILDKIPLVLIIAVIVIILFYIFPLAFFLCIVVPFLTLKTAYHAFVKHMHEHSLWWDIPLVLAITLFILLVFLYLNGYRF